MVAKSKKMKKNCRIFCIFYAFVLLLLDTPRVAAETNGTGAAADTVSDTTATVAAGTGAIAAEAEEKKPTTFETDYAVYDRNTGMFTTVGDVNVDYKDNKLKTDRIEYDTKSSELKASGRVDIVNSDATMDTSNVSFNTKGDVGSTGEINVKFGQNSYAKAESSQMESENTVVLNDVEYTACKEGLNDCQDPPTWKIGANRIVHNTETGSLFYTNALLYMWDYPVFYLPFLQNYTPNIKNKSGLLIPKFGTSSIMGRMLQLPVFIKINDYNDMTLTPIFTSKNGMFWGAEYRTNQYFFTSVNTGSFKPKDDDENNRWYFKTENYFEIDDVWRGKLEVARASDDTYLRQYLSDYSSWLTSQLELEGASNRSYLTADFYLYQDFRDLDNLYEPKVLPIVNYRRVGEPNRYGGYFDLNINTANVILDYEDTDVRDERSFRTSGVLRYNQPFITSGGHWLEWGAQVRGDVFVLKDISVDDTDTYPDGYYTGSKGRANVSTDLTWKYPLYRSYDNRTEVIEPVVQVVASPKRSSSSVIPNFDSSYLELSADNLIDTDRFAGYDVYETGTRVNYGMQFIQNYKNDQKLSFFLGQNYNVDVPDDIYLANSGLKNKSGFSDFVASITYTPMQYFTLKYKTRLDSSDFDANRHDVYINAGPKAFNVSVNYVYMKDMYIEDEESVRKNEIYGAISSQLTRKWRVFAGERYDIYNSHVLSLNAGVEYENDCFKFNVNLVKNNSRDRDYVGPKVIYFTLTFRTLGSVSSSFGISSASYNGDLSELYGDTDGTTTSGTNTTSTTITDGSGS